MKTQFIFSLLRVGTSFLYYCVIFITACLVVMGGLAISGKQLGQGRTQFSHEVQAFQVGQKKPEGYFFDGKGPLVFGIEGQKSDARFSPDNLIRYFPVVNRYRLEVKPNSVFGYYSFSVVVLHFLLTIFILRLFRRIFREASTGEMFKQSIFKHLITLAILFGASDILKLAHYIAFNTIVHKYIPNPNFDLMTEIGNGITTGLIIYAIAVVYQRGLYIQEENALTV